VRRCSGVASLGARRFLCRFLYRFLRRRWFGQGFAAQLGLLEQVALVVV